MLGAMSSYPIMAAAIGAAAFIHCGSPSQAAVDADGIVADAAVTQEEERPVPGLAAAWAIHDGEKVERDDLAHPGRIANAAWRDGTARIFGGRNEIVAFQVVVESDAAGIGGLDVRLPGL